MCYEDRVLHMKEKEIAVRLKNVSKSYMLFKNEKQRVRTMLLGKKPREVKKVVNDVSIDVYRGESVALFGQNGAGKSTILKMITGVTYPTEGSIHVDGRVSALLELTAGFDMELTGRENIYFRGEIMGIPHKDIQAQEEEIIAFAELEQYIDQPVKTYSSGMRARLGFAISASIKPDILIVDEALSVGDANFRIKCLDKINQILESGATFLFVTHALTEAKRFCKRGIVIERGKVFFDGDVVEAAYFYDKVLGRR